MRSLREMEEIKRRVREIINNNCWINGTYDYLDGDISALANAEEDFNENLIIEYDNLKRLFKDLKNYNGIFLYKNILFINHWNYGCFLYDLKTEDYKNYFEHLTIDGMGFKKFCEIVNKRLRG
ncbi:MAG: hypothetical protein C0169_00085 [Thermodesulfobacterium geofontis]|uniref:Uncharacterized protein n=1 Tax=Thermodesulfobacterium geofontis TaxID=1295609 RepID=A0A2N7QGW8_9BACT|nr:MAG: hypothetical protein C0169_00085 [Thermodesulfobacterium geofontis]